MRNVYGIGEALLDVIFRNNVPICANAGGSTLNSMISLGRMGNNVSFIGETGDDHVGGIIRKSLSKNGVSCNYLKGRSEVSSTVAMAFLNENNDAEYQFYKDDAVLSFPDTIPDFKPDDVVMFGSFFALNPAIRPRLKNLLNIARNNGALIIYDPNFRKSHSSDGLLQTFEDNFSLAHIVRGSNEDFSNIYGIDSEKEMADKVKPFCSNIIITTGSSHVSLNTEDFTERYNVPKIETVSTVGAGDSFNAGLIHGIIKLGITTDDIRHLDKETWRNIIDMGIKFASEVCCSTENYVGRK